MNSQKGFANILLISLIPLLLAGGFCLFSGFAFFKSDLATLNICRSRQLQVFNKVGKNLTKLLKLNPKALRLRLAEARGQQALMVAIEAGNPPAIAAAEAYLLYIQTQRQVLNINQRTLIETANMQLQMSSRSLQQNLQREWRTHMGPLRPWLSANLILSSSKVPTLAVKADIPEVAPLYQQLPNFEEAQAWSQHWSVQIKTTSWVSQFFRFNGRFERSCESSLYSEVDTWVAKLKKARSLSKAFF